MSAGGAGATPAHLPVRHLPVMFAEVMEGLAVKAEGTYLDGTFGRGGHARGVLAKLGPGGRLLVMDKDPEAIAVAEALTGEDARVALRRGSFADLAHWPLAAAGLDGVLFDLGVSSPQLDVAERGFSFGKDGPLDMRMAQEGESAAEWLNRADEEEIADVLYHYGDERQSRRVARALVAARPLSRTGELATVIRKALRHPPGAPKDPATKSFQAIRIHINRELEDLEAGLAAAHAALKPEGRLAVISFHSLEDRIVKRFMASKAKAPPTDRRRPDTVAFTPTLKLIGGAIKADEAETRANPRARSAVLRVAEKWGEAA